MLAYLSVRPQGGLNVPSQVSFFAGLTQPLKPASPYRRDQVRQNHAAALMTLELVLTASRYHRSAAATPASDTRSSAHERSDAGGRTCSRNCVT